MLRAAFHLVGEGGTVIYGPGGPLNRGSIGNVENIQILSAREKVKQSIYCSLKYEVIAVVTPRAAALLLRRVQAEIDEVGYVVERGGFPNAIAGSGGIVDGKSKKFGFWRPAEAISTSG